MISSLYAPVIVVILLSSGYNAPDMVFHGSHFLYTIPSGLFGVERTRLWYGTSSSLLIFLNGQVIYHFQNDLLIPLI